MKVSRSNRHGLFKPEVSLQENPEQQGTGGEYVGFVPRSNWINLSRKAPFASWNSVRTKTDTGR